MDEARTTLLIESLLNGDADAAQRGELSSLLAAEPRAVSMYWNAVQQEVLISQILQEQRGSALVDSTLGDDSPERGIRTSPPHTRHSAGGSPAESLKIWGKFRNSSLAVWGALAVGLMLMLVTASLVVWPKRDLPPLVVAEVGGDVKFVRQGKSSPLSTITLLAAGDEIQTGESYDSRAIVRYADGTQLDLSRRTKLSLPALGERETGKHIRLLAGSVRGDVCKQPPGQPLRFDTPTASVKVLGTIFRSDCSDQVTNLALDEGSLSVVRQADGAKLLLKAGELVVVDNQRRPLQAVPQPKRYARPHSVVPTWLTCGVSVSPDNRWLAISQVNRPLLLCDRQTLRVVRDFPPNSRAGAAHFSSDGSQLLTATENGDIERFDANDQWRQLASLRGLKTKGSILQQNRAGITLAASRKDSQGPILQVVVWDGEGKILYDKKYPTEEIRSIAIHPEQPWLAIGTGSGEIRLQSLNPAGPVAGKSVSKHPVEAIAFSPNGDRLACALEWGRIGIFATDDLRQTTTLQGHLGPVVALRFTTDAGGSNGQRLVSGSRDDTCRMWDLNSSLEIATFASHRSSVIYLDISADGTKLITGAAEKQALVWQIE